MRAIVIFVVLVIAVPCHAEDPLETLHTIQDTIATMEQTLKQRAASERLPVSDRVYFTSAELVNENSQVHLSPIGTDVARQDRKPKLRRAE